MSKTIATLLTDAQRLRYDEDGFLVLRRVFGPDEIQELLDETVRLLSECRDRISPRNLRCRFMPHYVTGEPLFEVFDPVNDLSPVCERFARDARLLGILERLYGEPACLFKEKLIYKPPGATGYKLHQDIPLSWKGFPRTFVTVLLAIDPCEAANGGTELFRGYHHHHLCSDPSVYMLPDGTCDPFRGELLNLSPGDLAIFHGLTPHRSGPNRSPRMRRTLYLSYNARSDGGDQRAAHYAEFQRQMRTHLEQQSNEPVFFS
jgi:hypothetical protein